MTLGVAGMGWVTPLGSGVDFVWDQLVQGKAAMAEQIAAEPGRRSYPVFRVPNSALTGLPSHPRLRRVSAISRFAVAAGLQALSGAGIAVDRGKADRIALVFAISNGGVIYTRRFYSDIVERGAQSASPLLFPETVFNAPASHLAAVLGTTGAAYTLIGDGAVGLAAIRMAEDVMANDEFDYCLVVGAEEVDWLLCDAYWRWRLVRAEPPIEPFRNARRGTILSEGSGAVLLARDAPVKIDKAHAGGDYANRVEAPRVVRGVLSDLVDEQTGVIVASANGTFVDRLEACALSELQCPAITYTLKPALGESVGAGGLWQMIVGAQILLRRQVPPVLHAPVNPPVRLAAEGTSSVATRRVVALACGLNQQVAGVRLSCEK